MESPRPRPLPKPPARPGSRRFLWLLAGVLGVALAGAGARVMYLRSRPRIVHGDPEPQPRILRLHFDQAKNHIREFKWREAQASLLELRLLSPDYPGLVDYLSLVEKELPNHAHLKTAQAALAEHKLAVAKTELDQVNPDTVMFERAVSLKRELRDAADQRVAEARAQLTTGPREPALAILEDVLAAFPDHPEAQQLRTQHFISCEYPVSPPPPLPVDVWRQVVATFKRQDLLGATALAQACASRDPRCKSGLRDLKEFSTLEKRLDALKLPELLQLIRLDHQLTESTAPSPLITRAVPRAAGLLYERARAANARGQKRQATRDAQQVLQLDPGHAGAALLLSSLTNELSL